MCSWDDAEARDFGFLDPEGAAVELPAVPLPLAFEVVPTPPGLSTLREWRMLEGGVGYFRPGDFRPPADSGCTSARVFRAPAGRRRDRRARWRDPARWRARR